MRLLFIDPSIVALGWALFELKNKQGRYIHSGHVDLTGGSWIEKIDYMVDEMIEWTNESQVCRVIVEKPDHWHSAIGSRGDAAKNSGAILKLTSFIMVYRYAVKVKCPRVKEFEMISVGKWKGNVGKEVTQSRVKRAWNIWIEDLNESDAVGLGDWYIRKHLKFKCCPRK